MRSIKFRQLALEKTNNHQHQDDNHKDIVGYLQDVRNKKPDEFTEYAMVSALTSNIFAGSDTTAISLRAMIWFLLHNPDSWERFLRELRERRDAGLISNPIRFDEAESWPYLQAIMYEAMRLHPPFAVHLPRVVPKGGMVSNGIFIPANVSQSASFPTVSCNLSATDSCRY